MQGENNKTTTQDENNITTTQGGSEQCKMEMNAIYKNNQKRKTSTTYKSNPQKKTQVKRLESLWVLYIVGLLDEGATLNFKPKFPLPSQTPNPDPNPRP
jgi:ATP sulfurylase